VESIGILGGTFNPPHRGHLALASHAREELGLERVLLMPARMPPHKTGADDPGPEHRLQMCRLLVGDREGLSASELELRRGGLSYTVDTLGEMHASHPGAELTFIVGADTALTLGSWREPARILELCTLAVAGRPGSASGPVSQLLAQLAGPAAPAPVARFLALEPMDVSSSMARERAARGEDPSELTGRDVAGYISRHRLYGAPSEWAR